MDRILTDDDWAPLREAVPGFAARWGEVVADSCYDPTIPHCSLNELARFVAQEVLMRAPHELAVIGEVLEPMCDRAALLDDDALLGLLRVGFFENLILHADGLGIPLTRVQPVLCGPRTREQWDRAIGWLKPGFVWFDDAGAVPTGPRLRPVGTVELHRGWVQDEVCRMDVRRVSGELASGAVIRRQISKDFWMDWMIAEVRLRSRDLPDEFHLVLDIDSAVDPELGRESFQRQMDTFVYTEDERFWQIARP